MNILILCNHGNVRSVGLKYLIQRIYEHDVLAAGIEENSEETISLLTLWADMIIPMTSECLPYLDKLSLTDKTNTIYVDKIGDDIWHNPFHQELQHKLLKHIKELAL